MQPAHVAHVGPCNAQVVYEGRCRSALLYRVALVTTRKVAAAEELT